METYILKSAVFGKPPEKGYFIFYILNVWVIERKEAHRSSSTREYEQVCHNYTGYYVRDVGNACKFICLKNNIVRMIEHKIQFGPFQVILNNISMRK